MKRFITYLFAYENGVKTQNVGYAKTDIRGEECRMQIHVRKKGTAPAQVFFLVRDFAQTLVAIPVAQTVETMQGHVAEVSVHTENIQESGFSMKQMEGVAVVFLGQGYIASCWMDEPQEDFCRGQYRIFEWENAKPDSVQEDEGPDTLMMTSETEEALEQVNYEKTDIAGIRCMPKKYWYLCNNSFLVHGYFSYKYLIIKTVTKGEKTHKYIGVPGICEEPEKMMAMLFGFPEFEAEENRESEEQSFGYWLCPLE